MKEGWRLVTSLLTVCYRVCHNHILFYSSIRTDERVDCFLFSREGM